MFHRVYFGYWDKREIFLPRTRERAQGHRSILVSTQTNKTVWQRIQRNNPPSTRPLIK